MPAAIDPNAMAPLKAIGHESPSTTTLSPETLKRSLSGAGLDENGKKPTKRRAAKACAECRKRKVRCDVMYVYHKDQHGNPICSNCQMDHHECVVQPSKRRRKHGLPASPSSTENGQSQSARPWGNGIVNPADIIDSEDRRWSNSSHGSNEDDLSSPHVPHPIYQTANHQINRRQSLLPAVDDVNRLLGSASLHGDCVRTKIADAQMRRPVLKHDLPPFLKPLPPRMTSVDIQYLWAKGALSLPDSRVRNALLHSYIEYVHPYMPLVEIHEVLQIVSDGNGESGQLSLLLFQAIMFAGTAFVDMDYLREVGYPNRKAARKAFFQKARVLYDFDYEIDRVSLVQSLLLMTYWYETPDDQKDTWHWMGVAISLAHTIGLHRNPENANMDANKKKLWKRIWWSCFMRDRLVALGMRRPTRVKDGDFDVPMLKEQDFEIATLSPNITIIPQNSVLRDVGVQAQLAQMCIAKAKLCLCIGNVLSAQYSVLTRHHTGPDVQLSHSGIMLVPKKLDQKDEVEACDTQLSTWFAELPSSCKYSGHFPQGVSASSVFVQRSLLHMVYYTTLSALHRPQVLPSSTESACRDMQDHSRKMVREASREITSISRSLHHYGVEQYLPTTGVTVLLPAIIIHLLDIKSNDKEARRTAIEGFKQCMQVLEKLRDNYASADFATQFLEAAIRKADIAPLMPSREEVREEVRGEQPALQKPTPPPERLQSLQVNVPHALDDANSLGLTPPDSSHPMENQNFGIHFEQQTDFDMDDFLNFDANNEWNLPLEEGAHGESGGFMDDMAWVNQSAGAKSGMNSPSMYAHADEDNEVEMGNLPEPAVDVAGLFLERSLGME